MSYRTWSVDGYGISTDDINPDKEQLLSFISQAPIFEADFKEWIDGYAEVPDDITVEEMEDYEDESGNRGIAPIMSAVILELEKIDLTVVSDVCGITYLLLEPAYPWSNLSDQERSLTEESAYDLFMKYSRMLTDADVVPTYQSPECGG